MGVCTGHNNYAREELDKSLTHGHVPIHTTPGLLRPFPGGMPIRPLMPECLTPSPAVPPARWKTVGGATILSPGWARYTGPGTKKRPLNGALQMKLEEIDRRSADQQISSQSLHPCHHQQGREQLLSSRAGQPRCTQW